MLRLGWAETKLLFSVLLAKKIFLQRNKGWFLRPPGPVSWSGSAAQDASDLCARASPPLLPFFLGGGVALHERLVGQAGCQKAPDPFFPVPREPARCQQTGAIARLLTK
jgi:hypothetical protein